MAHQDAGARPRRRIRVFPEWGVDFPLWGAPSELEKTGEYPYPYDPDDLPQVPSDLVEELAAWSQAWATRAAEEMGEIPPHPLTQQERHQEELGWKNQGKALVENLRAVLGDDFEIIYEG